MIRLKRAVLLGGPLLFCVWLYWNATGAWFQQDDFRWLSLRDAIHSPADWPRAFFFPMAQGTVRPLSERLFFIVFSKLFGLNAIPLHVWVLLTQFRFRAWPGCLGMGRRVPGDGTDVCLD